MLGPVDDTTVAELRSKLSPAFRIFGVHISDLNCAELLLILVSAITGCVSIYAFTSLVCVRVGITSSSVGKKVCAITAGIEKC